MLYKYIVCFLCLGIILANETSELKKKDPEQNKPSLLKLAETIYEVTRFVKNN